MATDRTTPITIESEIPELAGQVRPLRDDEIRSSLMVSLVPLVDVIRQNTVVDLGLRPYRVFLIHVQWSGAKPGDGQPTEMSRREIKPTPRVRDMSSTTEVLSAFGRLEEGGIVVDKISAKFSEDDLMGKTPDLVNPARPRTGKRNGEFFWEVQENRPVNPNPIPRRYVPAAAPTLMRGGSHWRVPLNKQNTDRSRTQTFDRRQA
jgi:hypothetical protein